MQAQGPVLLCVWLRTILTFNLSLLFRRSWLLDDLIAKINDDLIARINNDLIARINVILSSSLA